MTFRRVLRSFMRFMGSRPVVISLVFALVLFWIAGCAGMVIGGTKMLDQECPERSKVAVMRYINDPRASEWCAAHGAPVQLWSGCTSCVDHGDHNECTIRLPGRPNEVSPNLLADETQHVLGCVHIKEKTT